MSNPTAKLRRSAKALRRAYAAGEPEARARVAAQFPTPPQTLIHADALYVIAREAGHASWPKLKFALEMKEMDAASRRHRLMVALYYGQHWVAERLLVGDPGLGRASFNLMCALYDAEGVTEALAADPSLANRVDGARSPILHLAFSQHIHGAGSQEHMLAVAEALLAKGADVNDSYPAEPGSDNRLSALYGALGHANNLVLGDWLLARGAAPDDGESLYHATELGHSKGVALLCRYGARPDGTNALARAIDFDNLEMVDLLLAQGADPNEGAQPHPSGQPSYAVPALHQAARRQASAAIAARLIEAGADARAAYRGHSAYAYAKVYGNAAVADVIEAAGQAAPLDPAEALLAAAAEGPVRGRIDPDALSDETRLLLHRLLGWSEDLAHFKRLAGLGLDPAWTDEMGMPAIHLAGWEGRPSVVEWLLDFGPDLAHENAYGGDLLGTIIHGAEFCPARAQRDHIGCARLALTAGAVLRPDEIEMTGSEEMADFLSDWAESHPPEAGPG